MWSTVGRSGQVPKNLDASRSSQPLPAAGGVRRVSQARGPRLRGEASDP